ncbi:alanine dehydrogenase [Demequina sp. TTPB684]|uniref:alanine dehydrogenase n=1 Tax=unclassified Demequina TaxID=2620311 RepID=UPI001CF4A948|nr:MULTISPECIES: alanine dehydrogenase [unclassified Demequina]MCB2413403.1 alanine dehydrogenase [Demequina sp. TTPB684]UPU87966.1 alanine dehydrogenase [Demequina sp. TMPB413]
MRIGIPAEVKNNETRVAVTPGGVHALVAAGHDVLIQAGAGQGSSLSDDEYVDAGARIVGVEDAWSCETVLKVKEPIPSEFGYLRAGLTLFTYLHLAANEPLTRALVESGTTAIAYETVQLADGSLPLLAPMSEVAGRMAAHVGSYHLMSSQGGRGVLISGVPGVRPAKVAVLGAGVAGWGAIGQAAGMGADVTVLDLSVPRLRHIDDVLRGRVRTVASNAYEVERTVLEADLVIGAVLVPGARAPRLVSRELVSRMKPGSVLVDVAIDQGGCFEDSRPTTHAEPTYRVAESTFYCVANMPGAVGNTSTIALTNATLPYVLAMAASGWDEASAADPALAKGLAVSGGRIRNAPTAAAFPDLPAA